VGDELILGGFKYLEIFNIETCKITSTNLFKEGSTINAINAINDIIAIDETHYLLAGDNGLLKTTKDQLIKHYHRGKDI
jgi:hypothetical protein